MHGSVEGDDIGCVCWSPDGGQLAVGTGAGRVQTFRLVDEPLYWSHYVVRTLEPTCLEVDRDDDP